MYGATVYLVVLALALREAYARADQYVGLKSAARIHSTFITNIGKLYKCKYQICDEAENYPHDHIEEAMHHQHTLKSLLKDDPLLNATAAGFTLGSRLGITFTQLCNVEGPTTHKPRGMRNINNEWKYIVNTDKYHQTFTVETCRQLASPQHKMNGNRNYCTEFKYQCKQNTQMLSLLIYEEGNIRFDRFIIPTTCKCCTEI